MFVNEQTAPQLDNQQPLEGEEKARHPTHPHPTYSILCLVYLTYVLMFVNEQATNQLDNQQPLVGEEKPRHGTHLHPSYIMSCIPDICSDVCQ